METNPLVLIIDDEAAFTAPLAETFRADGLRVIISHFAVEGLEKAIAYRPDMIILDVNLQSEGQGFELLPRLHQATTASIVVLTGRETVRQDLEAASRGGATHYFNKADALPVTLSAFIRSQLAQMGRMQPKRLRLGPVVLDVDAGKFLIQGVPVPLTEMQVSIVAALLQPPAGHWKTHDEIAAHLYGASGWDERSGVRKHIARIRSRLEALDLGVVVDTAHAHGYRLVVQGVNEEDPQAGA